MIDRSFIFCALSVSTETSLCSHTSPTMMACHLVGSLCSMFSLKCYSYPVPFVTLNFYAKTSTVINIGVTSIFRVVKCRAESPATLVTYRLPHTLKVDADIVFAQIDESFLPDFVTSGQACIALGNQHRLRHIAKWHSHGNVPDCTGLLVSIVYIHLKKLIIITVQYRLHQRRRFCTTKKQGLHDTIKNAAMYQVHASVLRFKEGHYCFSMSKFLPQ